LGAADRGADRPGSGDGVTGAAAERLGIRPAPVPALPGAYPGDGAGPTEAAAQADRGQPAARRGRRGAGGGWSPGQIAGKLKRDHPGRPELQVSHETIYQALFVQGKGQPARRGRRRDPVRPRSPPPARSRSGEARGKIPGMINISEQPAEADDRAVLATVRKATSSSAPACSPR
jgi:hypothetical protein